MIRKYWKYLRFIIVPIALLVLCVILYQLLDVVSMGVLADWFDKMFLYETCTETEGGEILITRNISWYGVKTFLFEVLLGCVMFGSWLLIVIIDIGKRRVRRKHAHQIATYLHRFLLTDEPIPLEMPQEDSEVFSKIAEIRLEMNRNETLLREEAQRKNDLITYLAHDLKTPLTSVIGYLTLLSDEPNLPVQQRERYVGIATKKAERLEELTTELFEITRYNLSRIELQTEEVNLSRMLAQIVSEFTPLLTEKLLSIRTDIAQDILYTCDIDKVERIIDNLIRNAVNYSYPSSEIQISLKCDGSAVQMIFKNRGKTIPPEKLNRIFEQFYRLDSSRSSTTGGSGLGLAIARQLIEAHGGRISAESAHENICFTVTLPLKKIV